MSPETKQKIAEYTVIGVVVLICISLVLFTNL
jgi:hypothetical protein